MFYASQSSVLDDRIDVFRAVLRFERPPEETENREKKEDKTVLKMKLEKKTFESGTICPSNPSPWTLDTPSRGW